MSYVEAGDLSLHLQIALCVANVILEGQVHQLSSSHLLDLGLTCRSSNHVLMQTGFCDVQGSIYQMMRHRCQTNLINLVVNRKGLDIVKADQIVEFTFAFETENCEDNLYKLTSTRIMK